MLRGSWFRAPLCRQWFLNATGSKSPFTSVQVRKHGRRRLLATTFGITRKIRHYGMIHPVVFLVLPSLVTLGLWGKKAVTELWIQLLFIHYSAYIQCKTGHSIFSASGLGRTSSLLNHRASLVWLAIMARSMKGPTEEDENVNYGEKMIFTLTLFRLTKHENISVHLFYLNFVLLCHVQSCMRDRADC